MGVSNNITAVLNLIALMASIPIIASGVWLASKPDNECIHTFRWYLLILGILILLISITGFIGAYWNKQGLLAFYLCCMAILIALLLFLLVFAFIVTRPDGSYAVPGRGYRESRLDGFSAWLRNHVTDSRSWNRIMTCLADSDVCIKLTQDYITADQFLNSHITPLQSGCCKPPTACGYNYVNPILWISPVNPMADPDCYLWQTQIATYGTMHARQVYLGTSEKSGGKPISSWLWLLWFLSRSIWPVVPTKMLKQKTSSAATNGVGFDPFSSQ